MSATEIKVNSLVEHINSLRSRLNKTNIAFRTSPTTNNQHPKRYVRPHQYEKVLGGEKKAPLRKKVDRPRTIRWNLARDATALRLIVRTHCFCVSNYNINKSYQWSIPAVWFMSIFIFDSQTIFLLDIFFFVQ